MDMQGACHKGKGKRFDGGSHSRLYLRVGKALLDKVGGNKLPFYHPPNIIGQFLPLTGQNSRSKGNTPATNIPGSEGAKQHFNSDGIGYIPNNCPHQGRNNKDKEPIHGPSFLS